MTVPLRRLRRPDRRRTVRGGAEVAERQIDQPRFADDAVPGHRSPETGVAAIRPVVAQDEVLVRAKLHVAVLAEAGRLYRPQIAFLELPAVDEDMAVAHLHALARLADHTLDEVALAVGRDGQRRLEDDHVAAPWPVKEVVCAVVRLPERDPVRDRLQVEARVE